jgi:hypothetical protein
LSDHIAWALRRSRAGRRSRSWPTTGRGLQRQFVPGERHPAWLLGHLLLADSYLLFLLDARPLPDDFPAHRAWPGVGAGPRRARALRRTNWSRLTATDARVYWPAC